MQYMKSISTIEQLIFISISCYSDARGRYDFYKHSNVGEVVSCTDTLKQIRARVEAELVHWPDHAVLNDVSGFYKYGFQHVSVS